MSSAAFGEARPFARQHHLVNRWWPDAEVFLRFGFGRRTAVQAFVRVEIGQVLALLGREVFSKRHTPVIRFSW